MGNNRKSVNDNRGPERERSADLTIFSRTLYQRSADMFLGVPFNIASYSLLTTLVAQQCDLKPGDFVWTGGDCHVYLNHIDQVLTQLSRAPYPYPTLAVDKAKDLFSYDYSDFHVSNYEHWGALKGKVAV